LWPARATVPGDLVLFQFDKDASADHIGIIEKDNGDTITTIEGNTAPNNDANGGAVMRRTRKKSLIMAVIRPDYASVEPKTVSVELDVLQKGSRGESVKALQRLLIGNGLGCGKSGVDGIYGNDTAVAVKEFQRRNGLTVDAIVGRDSWRKLLGR
jgi:peptidoglycan hydrolase-like protein with peptidoglycan-binding domain